jgi:hypothetical protein
MNKSKSNNNNNSTTVKNVGPLPANNISQQLFYTLLPNCETGVSRGPVAPCCQNDLKLESFYKAAPKSLWNTATNYEGGPGFSNCTDEALVKQCFLSQYYNYLSKNNTLG